MPSAASWSRQRRCRGSSSLTQTAPRFTSPLLCSIPRKTHHELNNPGGDGGDGDDGDGDDNAAWSGGSSQPCPPPEAWRKIKNARRKLQGENPAAILMDDIAQVHAVEKKCFLSMFARNYDLGNWRNIPRDDGVVKRCCPSALSVHGMVLRHDRRCMRCSCCLTLDYVRRAHGEMETCVGEEQLTPLSTRQQETYYIRSVSLCFAQLWVRLLCVITVVPVLGHVYHTSCRTYTSRGPGAWRRSRASSGGAAATGSGLGRKILTAGCPWKTRCVGVGSKVA